MDLDAFVAEHAAEWRRLEVLSRRRRLSAREADELVVLYQRAATHLSVVRSRLPDPSLVARLSRLVLAARAAVTGGSAFSWRSVGRFFTHGFPLVVYRSRRWWISVALIFVAVAGFFGFWFGTHPEALAVLMSDDTAQAVVDDEFENYYSTYAAPNFAAQVWSNNAWVGAQSFAGGILLLPAAYVLFQNALNLGLMGGLMVSRGRGDLFFGLIAPHGLLEMTAIFVAAGLGLRIGWSAIAPGPELSRGAAVAQAARTGMVGVLGLVAVFAVAASLEAFVTPSPLPLIVKDAIGVVVLLGFFVYVTIRGRAAEAESFDADVDTGS
ncbi:MAG: stage II sporulation protein M [Hamadaea sp.]|nr:stage II sporulation protein M [Hamadaea sp.]NUT02476.1 stage II sporulation protein M [Hamadaea sp.]